jgi:hypothetical protein
MAFHQEQTMRSTVNTISLAAALTAGSFLLVAPAEAQSKRNLSIVGTLTDEGVECQALRGDDGQLYTLSGDFSGFSTGDRVRVKGRVAEVSFCQQGTTIDVRQIKAGKPAR